MLSVTPPYNVSNTPPRQASPLPRRTDSLSTSIAKPKLTSPIVQSREDLKFARIILDAPIISEEIAEADEETRERRSEDRERELTEMLGRMANWVDELATLLQQAYKNQTDLETALTLTRSNLQLALANNEMLEEALKRGGGKDVGWRRWSEREGVRRTSSVRDYTQHDRPNSMADVPPTQPQTGTSRFFNFKSPLQRIAPSSNTSPTSTQGTSAATSPTAGDVDGHMHTAAAPSLLPSASIPSRSSTPAPSQNGSVPHALEPGRPPSPPSPSAREQALAAQLSKERAALQALSKEKTQLENELESLSQALFEEANKMVSMANRKLAETEEELRIATEQKEALRGALRIVEGENGQLRGRSPAPQAEENDTPQITVSTAPTPPASAGLTATRESFWSPVSPSVSTASAVSSSPSPSTAAPTPVQKASGHRWSVMPRTPRSRSAVRNEFEQAIRRMHDIVGGEGEEAEEDGEGGEGGEDGEGDVKTLKIPGPESLAAREEHPDTPPADLPPEPVSPRLEFVPRRSSESEVEDELKVGSGEHNPWTS